MFQKLLQWIQGVLNKMLNISSVKQALNLNVAITPFMAENLQKWSLMYINQSPWLSSEIKSLNLPASIAAELSRAVTIEMEVQISGSARADFLAEQMEKVVCNLRQYTEYASAKGGLWFKPYIKGDSIFVDYVQADQGYPIAFDSNGNMTACVFADVKTIGRDYYTRLEFHQMTDEGYRITNTAFKSTTQNALGIQVSLGVIDAWADLEPEAMITGIDKPLFAYFKMPFANNIDPISPLGVSAYARAVDLIEQADRQWSDFLWEFESGRRALYTDPLAFKKDTKTGNPILPDKRLYRLLDLNSKLDNKGLFEDWTPTLREVNLLNGLDAILKKIEFNCGLAQGTISDPSTVALTATEIKMSRQRTYATITDTQKSLEDALENLLYAMDVWCTLGNLAPAGKYTSTYTFDDSIVSDHDTQFTQDTQLVTMNAMPKWRMLVRNLGLSEVEAKQWVADSQGETPGLFGTTNPDPNAPDGINMPNDNMPDNMPVDVNA